MLRMNNRKSFFFQILYGLYNERETISPNCINCAILSVEGFNGRVGRPQTLVGGSSPSPGNRTIFAGTCVLIDIDALVMDKTSTVSDVDSLGLIV